MLSPKIKYLFPTILCLAAVHCFAMLAALAARAWFLAFQFVIIIALEVATAFGLRARRPWAGYAAIVVGMLALSSMYFPVSLLIFWWVTPEETREKVKTFIKTEYEAMKKK